jgi:ribokinase
LSADSVGEAAFVSADLFHLSGYALLAQPQRDAALHAIDLAAARGIPISLDLPGGIVATITADVRRLLPQLDTVVLDRSDLPHLFNQASNACGRSPVEAMLHARVRRVAMKGEGAQSSLYQMNSVDCAPWFEVEVEDTTGAGDAFAAGHIHGRVAGWTGRDCCRLANAFGALTVTRRGAGRAMPALSEVMALMQATESER